MLNLDKKRQTQKKLRDKGKSNFLLFIPCFIAYFFVSAYYFFALHLDMLLSDKEGRFLGIEIHGKANKYAASSHSAHSSRSASRGAESAKRAVRGDDYTPGGSRVKAGARLVSAFLMVCFVFSFLPMVGWVDFGLNLGVSAESATGDTAIAELEDKYPGYQYDIGSPVLHMLKDEKTRVDTNGFNTITWNVTDDVNDGAADGVFAGYGSALLQIKYNSDDKTPYTGIRLYINGVVKDENFFSPSNPLLTRRMVTGLKAVDDVTKEPIEYTFRLEAYYIPDHVYSRDYTEKVDAVVGDDGTTLKAEVPARVVYNEITNPAQKPAYRTDTTSSATTTLAFAPLPPLNVTASYNKGTKQTTLNWLASQSEGSDGVDGYAIYRVDVDTAPTVLEPLGKVQKGVLTYTDPATNLNDTTIYEYRVIAFKGIDPTTADYNAFADSIKSQYVLSDDTNARARIYTITAPPLNPEIDTAADSNSYTVSWDPVTRASGYEIYITNAANIDKDEDILNGTTTGTLYGRRVDRGTVTNFTDTDKTGYYLIRAYRNINGLPQPSVAVERTISSAETTSLPTDVSVLPADKSVWIEFTDPNLDDADAATGTQLAIPAGNPNYHYVITGTKAVTNETHTKNIAPVLNGVLDNRENQVYQITSFDDGTLLANGESWSFKVRVYRGQFSQSGDSPNYPLPVVIGNRVNPPVVTAVPQVVGGIIDLSWDEVVGADYYTVQYIPASENPIETNPLWQYAPGYSNTDKSTDLTSRIQGLAGSSTDYTYKITAYKYIYGGVDSTTNKMLSTLATPYSSTLYPFNDFPELSGAPTAALNGTNSSANVTWRAVTSTKYNITGYWIIGTGYNTDGSPNGMSVTDFVPVGTTSFNHQELGENITWKYKVAVACTIGTGTDFLGAYSAESNGVTVIPLTLLPPTDLQAKAAVNSIALSWNASPSTGVDGYAVYAGRTNGTLAQIGTTTTNSYTHNNLGVGETWYYFVKSYRNKANGDPEQSPRSTDIASATTGTGGTEGVVFPPTDFRGTVKDNTVDLTWTASRGSADGYYLYTKAGTTVSSTDYTKRYNTTKTTYLHDEPVSGDNSYVLVAYKYNTASGQYLYSEPTEIVTKKVGALPEDPNTDTTRLAAPLDFLVTTTDGEAKLTWKAVDGAYGYRVHATGPTGALVFDRSAVDFTHTPLINGERWTYYVTAITPSGTGVTEGVPTQSYTIIVGETLNAPQDFVFTAGNRQIDLDWSDVTGAEGYIVYLVNQTSKEFVPIAVVTESNYSATGLTNDTEYTFGLTAFKTVNGKKSLSEYAIPITAKPTTGSYTDLDRKIAIKGTAPHGMDRSDLMAAYANHGAFDGDVDIYIQTIDSSTLAIQNALSAYPGGLSSFMVYPFDITLYQAGTYIEPVLNPGYTVTVMLPLPDELVRYREYIQVMHLDEGGTLENLNRSFAEIEDTWCVQFEVLAFSPFAFVIYKDQIIEAGSGTGSFGVFAANAFGQIVNFPQAMVPFGMRIKRARKKTYRILRIRRKR